MKTMIGATVALLLGTAVQLAWAAEPDGLILPPGFHASVVHDGVGAGARHIAVRPNGDLYISTTPPKDGPQGIVALHLDANHKAVATERFGTVNGGTAIKFHDGALYAATPTTLYRYRFAGTALVPTAAPEVVLEGTPTSGHNNPGLAFDAKGNLYLAVPAPGNSCGDPATPKGQKPVGMTPCPQLNNRGGVWRFDAAKTGQKFPADGEMIATGIRNMTALDWSSAMNGLYGVMQDRNGPAHPPGFTGAGADGDTIAEEMHRMEKGANLGWPYSYYDINLKKRVASGEYGGDGQNAPKEKYQDPVAAFPAHQSPLDLTFYDGRQFPANYRGGAFVVFHGGSGADMPTGHHGYNVAFLPFDRVGKPGAPITFLDGIAGPDASYRNPAKAVYRPTGTAVAPDGSLYVVDDKKGRVWRISYDGKTN